MPVGGTWGKLLHVDLTDGRHWIEEPPDEIYIKLVGGRGLTAYLLLRDLPVGADPLGPDNLLIFAPGVLQGSNLPGSGRHGVGGKSPLTGAIASSGSGRLVGPRVQARRADAPSSTANRLSPSTSDPRRRSRASAPPSTCGAKTPQTSSGPFRPNWTTSASGAAQCGIVIENLALFANVLNDINRAPYRVAAWAQIAASAQGRGDAARCESLWSNAAASASSPSGWATITRLKPPGLSKSARRARHVAGRGERTAHQ